MVVILDDRSDDIEGNAKFFGDMFAIGGRSDSFTCNLAGIRWGRGV